MAFYGDGGGLSFADDFEAVAAEVIHAGDKYEFCG